MNKSALRLIAASGPWLAPIPSAFFIGRAIFVHLLSGWHGGAVKVPPAANLGVALVAGLAVEVLAIVSIHNALALYRWNDQPRVKRGWERAPLWQALGCAGLYLLTAILLLVVLEAVPWLAQYAPILFPFLAIVGAVNLAILDQHKARLERYGLNWDLSKRPASDCPAKPSDQRATAQRNRATASETASETSETTSENGSLACDFCDRVFRLSDYASERAAMNARNAHMRAHKGALDDE